MAPVLVVNGKLRQSSNVSEACITGDTGLWV